VLGNVSRIEEMVTADITGDGMEDLILVFDNSTGGGKDVSAFSGTGGFESLWTSTFSSIGSLKYSLYRHIFAYIDVIFSSSLSRVQALANLNEDNVPDVVLQITGKLMPNATSNSTWVLSLYRNRLLWKLYQYVNCNYRFELWTGKMGTF